MENQIKFRAWDKHKKKMVTDFVIHNGAAYPVEHKEELYDAWQIAVKAYGNELSFEKEVDKFMANFVTSDWVFIDFANWYGINEYEIMQYTGLKDKSGADICVNDIISDGKNTFRIYGMYGGFAIKAPHWAVDKTDLKTGDDLVMQPLSDVQTMSWIRDNCNVIGNIYQNPELVESKI